MAKLIKIESTWRGAVLKVEIDGPTVWVTYAGQRQLLPTCGQALRSEVYSLINGRAPGVPRKPGKAPRLSTRRNTAK